jgi:hypothetical protein
MSLEIETYWGHCTAADGIQRISRDNAPWRIEYQENKGYRAIANRNFKLGEVICREKPVTWCHGWHPFTEDQISEIKLQIDELDKTERDAFYEMANVFPEIEEKCAGIYMTNSFDMVGAEHPSCGMYLVVSHVISCSSLLLIGDRKIKPFLCSECSTDSSSGDTRGG